MVRGGFGVVHLVRSFVRFLPDVENANRNVKSIYRMIFIYIFVVCNKFHLYGVDCKTDENPLYWIRFVLASNRGTVMELGVTPFLISGLIMQLLISYKIIELDYNVPEDRALLNGGEKLLSIVIAISEAIAYVICGMYGPVGELGVVKAIVIILQLFFGGIVIICLAEVMAHGDGPPPTSGSVKDLSGKHSKAHLSSTLDAELSLKLKS